MRTQQSVLFGLILIFIGVVLLLGNFNIIPDLPRYVFYWPNIFLVLAVVSVSSGNYRGAAIFGLIWSFFMLHFYWHLHFRDLWPLIIMLVGVSIILRNKSGKVASGLVDDNFFEELNIFGGGNRIYTSQQLQGGKVTNIFGGSEIDLTQTVPHETTTIEIFTLFGGCKLIVPPEWHISMHTTAIFGGFEDKRDVSVQNGPTVYIRGLTIFGGGDIKSFR